MADTATIQAWLTEAETALHKLTIGEKEVSVGYDGKSVTFNNTNIGSLRAHVADLKRQLGIGGRSRPIGVVFR